MKKILLFLSALMVSQLASAWYLVGSGSLGNWTPGSAIEYTSKEGDLEVWENISLTKNQEFKFIKEKNWNTSLGSGSNIGATGATTTLHDNGGNCKWTGAAGTYTIKLDATNKKLYIVEGKAEEIVIPEGALSFYEGETVVFFINTANWSKVNAYVWGSSNNNAWPGEGMTVVEGVSINNKYNAYKWVNTKVNAPQNIIFNNGSSQTSDLKFVNGGVYDCNGTLLATITPTVVAVPTITVNYNPSTVYVNETVTFSANVINGDGFVVEYYINDEKIAGTTWTPTTAGEYTLTANLVDGTTVKATDSAVITVKENTEFSVYLEKATAYATTYIYCWGGYGNTWPGEEMKITESVNGNEYLKWTFKNIEQVNIIFNDNKGNQTNDITNVSATTYYRLNNKSGKTDVTIIDPNDVVEPETPESLTYNVTVPAGTPLCYIVGAFNGWDVANAPLMTKVDDTHYTITLDNVTKASEYKYTCGQSWDYVELKADRTDAANRTWSESDVVEAWLDMPTSTPDVIESLTYNVTVPAGTPACYIIGAYNGWSPAIATAMTKIDDTHYTVTLDEVSKSMEYKYICGQSWDYVELRADRTDVANRTWSENDVVEAWANIPNENPETPGTLTYNVTVPAGTPACYIVGAFNGWDVTNASQMTMVDETHYTITLENVTKSMEYKYVCAQDWVYVESRGENRKWSENDVVSAWDSLPNTPEEPELETLIYNVTVPYGTEACYIAGEMNGWTFTAMERVDENHFNITIDNVSKSMQYKYACGEDWEYVEMQADGVTDVANRTWNQYDTVEAWKNVWSGIADITANGINVYGTYNAICVSTTQEVTLYIYNMQGMLVETYTANGKATIAIAPGFYIVNNQRVLVY